MKFLYFSGWIFASDRIFTFFNIISIIGHKVYSGLNFEAKNVRRF